jgi:phosphatidylserine/phosphatidylglycerophosphate/cardiolipin synthase-like enzyme
MSIDLRVYDNGDHTCLVWLPSDGKSLPACRGYAIRRLSNGKESYLHGFIGFSDTDTLDPQNPWKFPLQRYMWWDYGVAPGDKVQYSIVPVVGPDKDHLKLSTADASALTPEMTITGQTTPSVAAYFNKGIVAAQWVSRALAKVGKDPKLADLIATPGNDLRNALSGLLRPQLLAMLDDAKKNNGEVYAALYELNDPELIARLTALGQKCHLLLANGAFKPPDNDENKAVRAALRSQVDLHDRLVTSGHFAHNKFLVVCDAGGKPQSVLSGSTNWTKSGLCTQANNGVIVNNPDIAAYFLNEWNLLKDAGNDYPTSLAKANSTAQTIAVDGGTITQWFAPTSGAQDLEYARKLINAAQDGILFLFFNPGAFAPADKPVIQWTLLQNVVARHQAGSPNYDADLYIRGVVNQEIAGLTSPATEPAKGAAKHATLDPTVVDNPVTLFSGGDQPPQRLTRDSMVPKNIKTTFHNWAAEMLGTGVHIHSKVIVLDPFGEKPVVMTGSHNLGYKASSKNDDNLMIIEGNAPLAAAFAVNIIAIYQNYRWNAYAEAHRQDPHVWHGLVDNDQWQESYLQGDDLAELKFWMGQPPSATAAPVASPIKSVTTPPVTKPPRKTPAKKKAGTKKAGKKKAASKKKPASKKTSNKTSKKAMSKKKSASKKATTRKKAPARKK